MIRSARPLAAAALAAAALAAFAASRPRYGGNLRVAVGASAIREDPALADAPEEAAISAVLSPPLCRVDAGGRVRPLRGALARPSALRARISLGPRRPGGATAAAILERWERLSQPATLSPYRALLAPLRYEGRRFDPPGAGLELELALAFPWPDLERSLCHPALGIPGAGAFTPTKAPGQYLANAGFPAGRPFADRLSVAVVSDRAAARLLQLQQADGGWGWQGNGATHEMMTPYALYGLLEAEREGYKAPSAGAAERGLDRLRYFIVSMREDQAADRLYCMYVHSIRFPIEPSWWAFIERQLEGDRLSDYSLALALEMAVRGRKSGLADKLAAALHRRAQESGGGVRFTTAGFSRWADDPLEVSAAVMKALVAHDPEDALIPKLAAYFAENKRGDRWNSTKDTAMIVCALCDLVARHKETAGAGDRVRIRVNRMEEREIPLAGALSKTFTLEGSRLEHGTITVRFADAPKGTLYRLALRYRESGPNLAAGDHGLSVNRRFYLLGNTGNREREVRSGEEVPRGAYLECEVTAHNGRGEAMRYVLVENPRPSGSEALPAEDPRFRQDSTPFVLREERVASVFFHHEEIRGVLQDRMVVHAEMAGDFCVPPAVAEMMYRPGTRGHSGAFTLKVR